MSRTRATAVLLAVAVMGGCASAPASERETAAGPDSRGTVGVSLFEPGAALDIERVVLARHESFLMPVADASNRLPTYPEALLPARLTPREVCLRVAVGVDGRVLSVVDVTGQTGCEAEAPVESGFVAAATQAAKDWRFDPAVRCVFASAADKRAAANTGCATAQEIPQAVSLSYRFVFEQRGGRGAVRQVR